MSPTASPPRGDQRKLVRDSFDLIRPQMRPVSLLFYGKLFELDPSARQLFHVDIAVQAKKLMDTLNAVAEAIDRLDALHGRLLELGRQHADYGVCPEQYDTVMRALMWSFTQALGADFDAPTREAWTQTLTHVCDVMKLGASSR
jgi:hemoglobin-like flavoprotein